MKIFLSKFHLETGEEKKYIVVILFYLSISFAVKWMHILFKYHNYEVMLPSLCRFTNGQLSADASENFKEKMKYLQKYFSNSEIHLRLKEAADCVPYRVGDSL